jgi:hypothetical protein
MRRGSSAGFANAHEECWALLPWVANGRATRKELARIDAHLRDCNTCRDELQTQRQLREAMRSQDGIMLAPQTSLQKLMKRIDAEDEPGSATAIKRPRSPNAPRTTPAAPRRRHWLAVAAAVQALAIAALLSALWVQSREVLNAPRFATLTSHESLAAGAVIRVVFAAETSVGELAILLRNVDARILAGPSDAGVYTLGLSAGSPDAARLAAALATLRADSRVLFAESAAMRSDSP